MREPKATASDIGRALQSLRKDFTASTAAIQIVNAKKQANALPCSCQTPRTDGSHENKCAVYRREAQRRSRKAKKTTASQLFPISAIERASGNRILVFHIMAKTEAEAVKKSNVRFASFLGYEKESAQIAV